MKRWIAALLAAISIGAAPLPLGSSPVLKVDPAEGLMDSRFKVHLSGLRPGARVEIRTIRKADKGPPWIGIGTFIADAKGVVDPETMPSTKGTYTGLSPHGLLCSPLPVAPQALDGYLANLASNPRQPTTFDDNLGGNTIEVTASVDDHLIGSTSIQRSYARGTSGEDVSEADGWKGVYFLPATGTKVSAPVLLLAGSGGGIFRFMAARLASHGHPTLAMALFRYPGLPGSLVRYPVENVRDAAAWLAKRADARQVAVVGISRGSEAAALAAANFPDVFSGVVLLVPSHLSDAGALGPDSKPGDPAWTIGGKPTAVTNLGFLPTDSRVVEQAKTRPGYNASAMVIDKWGSRALGAKYGIPFERISAPILVQAAGADAVWPSWISANYIQRELATRGRIKQVELHVYSDAGHNMVQIGLGSPLTLSGYNPLLKGFMAFGGTPNGTCEASFDSARDTLQFLDRIRY